MNRFPPSITEAVFAGAHNALADAAVDVELLIACTDAQAATEASVIAAAIEREQQALLAVQARWRVRSNRR